MSAAEIIKEAAADGVNLILSPADTITATGTRPVVERWLPTIRQSKSEILAELQRKRRRAKVLEMLGDKLYAVLVEDASTDPVIVTVAKRHVATFELAIPKHSYNGMVLLELIEKHTTRETLQ